MRQWDISRRSLNKQAAHWCNGFILHLLQITHRQWTFRNQTVHYKACDGLTAAQQDKIMSKCESLLWTDPSLLLTEDRSLLDLDFETLGNAPAIDRQIWIEEVEAAYCAAGVAPPSALAEYTAPTTDTEGSIRFRRRRKRSQGSLGVTTSTSSNSL